jgi:hypothetical protein
MTTTINTLLAKRHEFCYWIYTELSESERAHYAINHNFTRGFLRSVAIKHGMAWAPAWIVKDKSRQIIRGVYSVPEYSAYVASCAPATTPNVNSAT